MTNSEYMTMGFDLLRDIVIIFALSTLVNLVFNRIKIPTIVGYLLTGIIAGPHLLSVVHSEKQIDLLAELGVILLLFTIGIEFSLKHLLKIRRIVFFGGLLQFVVTAAFFYFISIFYNLDGQTGLFIGFIAALSSSALVLKMLQERSELTSNYGRTILGILIFQDLLLVPLLLYTNMLGNDNLSMTHEIFFLFLKAALIIGLVYTGNKWLLPRLLHLIARTKNQELFMMSIFLICLSIALLTYKMGMSLAFGAFLAGLMISESTYSHNAFSNIIPFKDIFTSFFFVSIGMLLDLDFVSHNYFLVIGSVLMVLIVKTVVAGGTGFILGHTFRGTVMVGLALSQVGEFSFILAKLGLDNAIISSYYYQLFLSVAIITMALTPFIIGISQPLAELLLKLPLPRVLVEGLFPLQEMDIPPLQNHLVIIGKDSSALKLSKMAKYNNIQHVSLIFDPMLVKEKLQNGEVVVYGDAVNEPILRKAYVNTANTVLISVGSLIPAMAITEKVRQLNKKVYIIARAKHIEDVEHLYRLGADQVLPEKLEIAINLFQRILSKRLVPHKEINRIINHIRSQNLGDFTEKDLLNQPTFLDQFPNMNISAIKVEFPSQGVNKSLNDIKLRNTTGATLLAVKRHQELIENPPANLVFQEQDTIYVVGNPEQVNLAFELFSKE